MIHSSGTAAALLGITVLVGVVAGNRCFVCVPRTGSWKNEAMKLFPDPPELPLCEHFHPKDKRYERVCPPGYNRCLTQSREHDVLRTCSNLNDAINDCQMANGVRYCFCSGSDLCNGNESQFPARPTIRPAQPANEDDEDDVTEGSGGGFPPTKASFSPTTAHPPHGTTITNVSPSHGSATISRALGFLPVMVALLTAKTQ